MKPFWRRSAPPAPAASAVPAPPGIEIMELTPMKARASKRPGPRLNLLLPTLEPMHLFGGIATALTFFKALAGADADLRIVLTDQSHAPTLSGADWEGWRCASIDDEDTAGRLVLPYGDRSTRTLPVRRGDLFVATGWWTAYGIQRLRNWQAQTFGAPPLPFVYLIQDFEPGFYAWSSRYLMALSTYQDPGPVIRVFNSHELQNSFADQALAPAPEFVMEPQFNAGLSSRRRKLQTVRKDRTLLLYGRPGTARNAFELACQGLREWVRTDARARQWNLLSVGETHGELALGEGCLLRSMGKLSLDEYASQLARASLGVSLMCSPHPSYPPLELAAFGARVLTNRFGPKDLSLRSPLIESMAAATPEAIGSRLHQMVNLAEADLGKDLPLPSMQGLFAAEDNPFPFMSELRNLCMNTS